MVRWSRGRSTYVISEMSHIAGCFDHIQEVGTQLIRREAQATQMDADDLTYGVGGSNKQLNLLERIVLGASLGSANPVHACREALIFSLCGMAS